MNKQHIVVGHALEDYDTASKFVALLRSFTNSNFETSQAVLGKMVFPQRLLASQHAPASNGIAFHILLCSQAALESQWLAVVAGFSRAKNIPTLLIRLRDGNAHDLPTSLVWFDAIELSWPQGWSMFCQKCRLKCHTFPTFLPSQEDHLKIFNWQPAEIAIKPLKFRQRLRLIIDEIVLRLKCWPEEDQAFMNTCDEAGITYQRGGHDASTTALDIIADDFILRLRRKHMDDFSIPHIPISGYDEPPKPGYYPHMRIYEIDFTFSIKLAAFCRIAPLVDLWRARMKLWKSVKVEIRLHDQWCIDRIKLRQLSDGTLPSDLVADLDETLLVEGIVIRLGNPRLIDGVGLRFQTLEFQWKWLLGDCHFEDAVVKLLKLGVIKRNQ
jgi:hypothetical protein